MRDARRAQSPELLTKLIDLARSEPRRGARRVAIESLGYFEDARVRDVLLELQDESTAIEFRGEALRAMARRRDPEAAKLLVAALSGDVMLRRAAIAGLVLMPTPEAFSPLSKLYAAAYEPMSYDDLMRAMILADRPRALALIFGELEKPNCKTRAQIARILREFPAPDVREHCLALIAKGDLELRRQLVRILGRAGNARTVPKLTWLLNEHESLRVDCIVALGEVGGARARRSLLPYLHAESNKVRAAAARSLARIADPTTCEAVIKALREEQDLEVQLELIAALGELEDPRAVRDLMAHLKDWRMLEQPLGISSIWGFPYNTRLRQVALWSLRRILKRKPAVELRNRSFRFGEPLLEEAEFKAIKAWWAQHADEARYSLESK